MKRRDFLKLSGGLLLASELGWAQSVATSSPQDAHMFLNIRVWGGMDCLLGLNPWTEARPDENDLFLDENYEYKSGVEGTRIGLGISAYPIAKFARHLCVIKGIFMGTTDLGHPAAQNYITTAKGSPNAPHFIAEAAEFFRKRRDDQAETVLFNADLKTFDLLELTRLPLQRLKQLAEERGGSSSFAFKRPTLSEGKSAVHRSWAQIQATQKQQETFFAKYKEFAAFLNPEDKAATMESELVAAAAFAADRARFAQVDWSYLSPLDSHENYPKEHQKNQRVVWERLARLLGAMSQVTHHASGLPLFPHHVTIAVLTEFGRLPYLNATRGKDHDFYDNAMLLGGRGIRGGQALGAHHLFGRDRKRKQAQLSGCHIDFRTGEVVKNDYYNTESVATIQENREVRLIRPENILRTLAEVLKVEPGAVRLFDKDTPVLPGVIAT